MQRQLCCSFRAAGLRCAQGGPQLAQLQAQAAGLALGPQQQAQHAQQQQQAQHFALDQAQLQAQHAQMQVRRHNPP